MRGVGALTSRRRFEPDAARAGALFGATPAADATASHWRFISRFIPRAPDASPTSRQVSGESLQWRRMMPSLQGTKTVGWGASNGLKPSDGRLQYGW